MGRANAITKAVRDYDPMLYCERREDGKLCVYRKSQRIESYDVDGTLIHFVRPAPYFVFALTNTWRVTGHAVDWGIEPILARLKALDLWKRDLAEDLIQDYEEQDAIRKKDARNNIESFLYEFRGKFKQTFNDVNVASMDKTDKRKLGEKNGYC